MKNLTTHSCVQYFLAEDRLFVIVPGVGAGMEITFGSISSSSMPLGSFSQPPD
jgi:hypothetical protein